MNEIVPIIFLNGRNVTNEQVIANIRANAGRDLPCIDYSMICVCGSGPSLKDHVETIRKRVARGFRVAAVNGAYKFLLEHDIVPDYFFMVDARQGMNLHFVENPHPNTLHVIASQCHPEIFDALEGYRVALWQVDNYKGAGDAIRELAPKATIFGGATNVGQSSLVPLALMGYRIMHLFGFDGPIRSDAPLEEAPKQHAFLQAQNDAEEKVEVFFEGERFIGTGTNAHDANAFVDRYNLVKSLGVKMEVYGDNLLPRMVKSRTSSLANITIPAPRPRARPMEKLQIVCWKWKGHIPYYPAHVNILASMFDRWLKMPHEIVCITDDPEGIDGGVRIVPMWRDHFEHGRDWHRLKIFSPEMVDTIGPRFVSVDLDTVVMGPLDPLFDHDEPFMAWQDPLRPHQYCTALFQMDAGCFPHVLETFNPNVAMQLRTSGKYNGYDQAWISHVLPGAPKWGTSHGVLSFKKDIIGGNELPGFADVPSDARMIMFHGKFDPSHEDVQRCCPWIAEAYR